MKDSVSRKTFLLRGSLATFAALAAPRLLAQIPTPATSPLIPDRGPQLAKEKVEAFVRAGHSDLAKVKEMLAAQPSIVNATWDWGSGDYETALGGASHMGRRDIAEVLLAAGARLDLFAAAALGKLYIVQAAAAVFDDILKVPGPHGISLLAHAQKGGSTEVVAFINDFLKPPPAWLNSTPSPKP
jgi:hypothetical protein